MLAPAPRSFQAHLTEAPRGCPLPRHCGVFAARVAGRSLCAVPRPPADRPPSCASLSRAGHAWSVTICSRASPRARNRATTSGAGVKLATMTSVTLSGVSSPSGCTGNPRNAIPAPPSPKTAVTSSPLAEGEERELRRLLRAVEGRAGLPILGKGEKLLPERRARLPVELARIVHVLVRQPRVFCAMPLGVRRYRARRGGIEVILMNPLRARRFR